MRTTRGTARALATVLAVAGAAGAQPVALTLPGSVADDRARLGQLTGDSTAVSYLARGASSSLPAASGRALLRPLLPAVAVRWNSGLATPDNDGLLWSGRGVSSLVRGGALVEWRRVRVIVAPELAVSENRSFEVFASTTPGRSAYASPWHTGRAPGDASIDLPLRFGDARRLSVSSGQSSVVYTRGAVAAGVSSENQWWGPGVRNALVLSGAAGGFPHAFVRTARPVGTFLGALDARAIAGGLTRSTYFDSVPASRHRSLSGLTAALAPRGVPGLTLGVSRLVVRPARSSGRLAAQAADALLVWEAHPSAAADSARANGADSLGRTADQLTGLSARYAVPGARFEVYAEWVRQELPGSLRDLLLAPHATQGYTLGLQWASREVARLGGVVRLQGELTTVEQSVTIRERATRDFYTGFVTPEGFTQRGQPLGAAIGPGGSSQFVAADVVASRWDVGLFANRVRWSNDALYRQPVANFFRHDVSIAAGARAAYRSRLVDVRAEASYSTRYNYLFQNGFNNPGGIRTVDVNNVSLGLTLTPR